MLDGIISTSNVSFILVFLEGILSFFSPCVIPLIPVYMSYLAGNAKQVDKDGIITYQRKKVFLHTVFFVLGISFAFFVLGMSFSKLGTYFYSNKLLFTRIGGILIVILGLFQLGILDFKFLQRERKINLNLAEKKVNPLIALLMGFTFSFAWTPCIGPALSSVLILASGAKSSFTGNMLVLVYAIGFVLPFLILGLFTTQALDFLKSKQKLLKYTIKVGGIILIIMGVMTFTGWMNGVSGYLNSFQKDSNPLNIDGPISGEATVEETGEASIEDSGEETIETTDSIDDTDTTEGNENQGDAEVFPAIDFTLTDQYGNEHTLADYKGKVVFLNFWATWCPPCREEMPNIEELYNEYNLNKDEVVILGVANPKSDGFMNNQDVEADEVIKFLDENGYTFPVVFDETGDILSQYQIGAFPTTFMINKEGNITGYVAGSLTKDIMKNMIQETIKSTD